MAVRRLKRKTEALYSEIERMGPQRKKSKPNPVEEAVQPTQGSTTNQQSNELPNPNTQKTSDTQITATPPPSRSSWSWRSKAAPTPATTSRESISVAQGATSESSAEAPPPTPTSLSKIKRGSSRKSIPLAAEATRVHATSDASTLSRPRLPSASAEKDGREMVVEEARLPPEPAVAGETKGGAGDRVSWFGWWSRPDGYGSDSEKVRKKQKVESDVEEVATSTPLPGTPVDEPEPAGLPNAQQFEGVGGRDAATKESDEMQSETKAEQTSSRGWFAWWSSEQNQQAVEEHTAKNEDKTEDKPPEIVVSPEPPAVEEASTTTPDGMSEPTTTELHQRPRAKSSGWAFWLSDQPKDPPPTPGGTQKQVGELAVADTPSQSNPEAAQFNEQRDEQQQPKLEPKRVNSLLRSKKSKVKESPSTALSPADSSTAPTPATSQVPTPSETPPIQSDAETSKPQASTKTKRQKQPQQKPNQILPAFRTTYPLAPNPSYMERLTNYLAQSLNLPSSQPHLPPTQHISINPSPPKIKKAVALGIHGFFLGPLIQKVLGQPTGTSIRFANYAAAAIKDWCAEHQPDAKDTVEVEKIALEGEGLIADRVTTLWRLLLNWLNHIRGADFILVACHSQGVPVAIMLIAKLIQLGCLSDKVRVGVCAMAGINLGPFLEYRSRLYSGSALELFDFCDSNSAVSKAYADALDTCLRNNVRITFVGSLDDQLVSLESSLHAALTHPYVARAVFVDGRMHAPMFLTHLVVFALKLRNLGLSDHGLLRELSVPLAGSMVGGEGHSRIYDDAGVYKLATEFAMESSDIATLPPTSASASAPTPKATPALANSIRRPSLPGMAPILSAYEPPPNSTTTNPFFLPWAVRGVLEEPMVKGGMKSEVEMLVKEFEQWKPSSRMLRDVRWRLEGVAGMMG